MGDNNTTSEWTKVSRKASDGGKLAEDLSARFLEQRGLAVLTRNFRCRGGEIDLVCRDGKAIVFVEVRLRRNDDYGGAAASITARKQRRIILAAKLYLAAHGKTECACRFDCVLLDGEKIVWVRDAFAAN
ncbi:YraN family protein [Propionivibrio sp.]|uniref:YraN family protein n=1 Tax=Propionivibrio sp. TaxID=2212460 RepID=UPI0026072B02|nr:YraN family protein [Propionivibrio sp.]